METTTIVVVTRRRLSIDIADSIIVLVVRTKKIWVLNIVSSIAFELKVFKHLLRCFPQIDAQIVHQLQLTVGVDLSEDRHLSVSRATLN